MIIDKIKAILHEDKDFEDISEVYEDGDELINNEDEWDDNKHTINEAINKVKIIRNNRLINVARPTRPDHKLSDGEEVRMTLSERLARQKAAEKTAHWTSHRRDQADKKRYESIKRHKKLVDHKDVTGDRGNQMALNKTYDIKMIGSGL
jgi:hypothetical protein